MDKVLGGDSGGSHSTSQILGLFNEMWSGGSFLWNKWGHDTDVATPLVLKNYYAVTQKSWAAYGSTKTLLLYSICNSQERFQLARFERHSEMESSKSKVVMTASKLS